MVGNLPSLAYKNRHSSHLHLTGTAGIKTESTSVPEARFGTGASFGSSNATSKIEQNIGEISISSRHVLDWCDCPGKFQITLDMRSSSLG